MTERDSETGRYTSSGGGGSILVRELITGLGFSLDEDGLKKAEAGFKSLAGLAAAAVAGVVAAKLVLQHLAESAAEAGKAAEDTGLRLGITAEEAQRLAFSQSHTTDMSAELSAALFRLQHNAEAARKAGKGLGFETIDKATGRVKPLLGLAGSLADKMVSIQDPAARADLAFKTLGRGSQSLIPWLLKGAKGIEELGDEADDLGAIISDKDAKAAKEFVNVMHALHTATGAVWRRLGTALIPIFKELAERQIQLLKTMRPLIDKGIKVFVNVVEQAVHGFFKFQEVVKSHTRILVILGGVLTAYLIPSLVRLGVVSLVSATRSVIAWAAAAAPFIALGLAIGAVALILEDVWVFATGGKSLLGDLIDTFVNAPEDVEDNWLVKTLRAILGTLVEAQHIVDRLFSKNDVTKDMSPAQARAVHKREADEALGGWTDILSNMILGKTITQYDTEKPTSRTFSQMFGPGRYEHTGDVSVTVNAKTSDPEAVGKAALDGTTDALNMVLQRSSEEGLNTVLRRTNDNVLSPVKR